MNTQTIFLHNVTSIEVINKPFISENELYNQIKIIIQCNDGKDRMESEIILISNDKSEITWYGDVDNLSQYKEE